jgi:hypothetical protein
MPEYWQNLIPDRDALVDDRRRVEPITDTYLEARAEEDRRRLPPPPEVQTRIMELDPAEATERLREWLDGADEVTGVPAPPGVLARQRVRRDTRPPVGGQPSLRRQRIAVMAGETRTWGRVLVGARAPDGRGRGALAPGARPHLGGRRSRERRRLDRLSGTGPGRVRLKSRAIGSRFP